MQGLRFAVAVFSDCLCNTHLQSSNLLPDFIPGKRLPIAALGRGRTNRSVKINRHLHFLGEEDSADSLAKRDQIDVGVSDPLQTGLGLFDPLHAVSPGPALRSACPGPARAGYNSKRLFHVPDLSPDGLGPLCTPAVRHSRRATLESPNLTAYLLVQALISLVWLVLGDDACECLIVWPYHPILAPCPD